MAWSTLPDSVQMWVLDKIEQGLGYTFDTFEEFYDWVLEDDDRAKIVADYINQTTSSEDGFIKLAHPKIADAIPKRDKDVLVKRWRARNGQGENGPQHSKPVARQHTELNDMKLSEHHVAENGRTAAVKRIQTMFNVHSVDATRQLQADMRSFVAMSSDELDGAISALLVAR
jgi:hypothetical protein